MKVKIHKTRKINEPILKEELLNENPALLRTLPALLKKLPWKEILPMLPDALGKIGGGNNEKAQKELAKAIAAEFRMDPLDVEGPELRSNISILDDIRKILHGINAGVAKLPQDPDTISATGDAHVPGDVDVVRGPAGKKKAPESREKPTTTEPRAEKQKYRAVRTVTELKSKVVENLRSLL
jgi:hypothetical protein